MRSLLLLLLILSSATQFALGQTPISPNIWSGSPTNPSSPTTSDFAPLPASTTPGAAAVAVSQFDRVGVIWNTAGGRYNSKGWGPASSTTTAEVTGNRYLTFTVTNNASTELRITGFAVTAGQASGTGPNTFGLAYKIGTAAIQYFPGSVSGASPNFTPIMTTPVVVCAGQTVRFYLCGWGNGNPAGTWSINANGASLTASFVTAVNATAGSNSPVTEGNPLNLTSTPATGITPYTYSWSGPLSYTATTQSPSIPVTTLPMAGVYSVTVTDAWGCSVVRPTTVVINPGASCSGTPPAGTATPTTTSFCGSGSTTLNLTGAGATAGLSYQWSSSNTNTPPGTDITGATSTAYTTPSITSTTYYWVTSTCPSSSTSSISAVGIVTVNPTPAVVVTPPGGDFCAGSSGLNMTASGAATYSWAPASGLSATVGAGVTATPSSTTTYTVTGTSAAGCPGQSAVTVNAYTAPGPITITPNPLVACLGGAVTPVTASLGSAGPATASSGTISLSFASGSPATASLAISSIPTGATITGIAVNFSVAQASGGWNADDIIALKAPNGNILNLFNAKGGSGSTGGINNMQVNSSSVTAIPATGSPYTGGSYMPDAVIGVGTPGSLSNVSSFSGLYSVPNGTWQLLGHYTFATGNSIFTEWTITITYTLPSFTWAPVTNLFTNAAGTTPYAGTLLNTVYQNPLVAGTTTYTVTAANGSCATSTTATVTVNSLPTAISGASSVCAGLATTLSNGIAGGAWASANSAIATVSAVGVVTGGAAGTTTISYGNGCAPDATATVTVISAPGPISGASALCFGATTPLSNAATGGTWSSTSSAVATIDPVSGLLSGVVAGTSVINYSTACGADATATITVIGAPGAISGALSVCSGLSTLLSNTVAGGTWSSSNTTVATTGSTGVVTGGAAGTAVINYTTGCGTDATFTITTIAPPSVISGASLVCMGLTTSLSNSVSGGVWSSSNTTVATVDAAGLVTAGVAGAATIRYSTGCGTDATQLINVISAPAAIGGASSVCVAASTTLSESITGGTWTSSNTTVATVGATGVVFGVGAGSVTINYSTGCGADVTRTLTVIAAPSPITGATSVCSGLTTQLSNAVPGGTWSSSVTTVATVGATGLVTAGLAGGVTISYSTGCGFNPIHVMTVIAAPTAVSGPATVCSGLTAQLSEAILGGTWTSSNTTIATVNTTGLVTGGAAGTAVINYSTGCGADVTHTITTIAAPAAIGGAATVCTGATLQLSQSVAMGTWSSSNTTIATVNATGLVSGVIAGPVTITYATGCGANATKAIAVIAPPAAISGASSVCNGFNIQLSNTVAGGTWSSSNSTVATVNSTGLVSSSSAGTTVIRYATGCGTDATRTVTVIAAPAAITGPGSVCSGAVMTLANASAGGTWSSSNSAVATIDASGNVSGANLGTTVIRYTTGCGADATRTVSVHVSPGGIAGSSSVCIGFTLALSNVISGGTWTSSNTFVATINSAGLVTSVLPGTTTITYSTGCGTDQNKVVTVIPNPGIISGPSSVCAAGGVITLSNTVAGGGWSSSNVPVASVNAAGDVTGGIAGTTVISYTTGCGTDATNTLTVIPVPAITLGTTSVCPGATSTLTNGAAGGTWSSSNTTIATVDAGGTVTAIVPGVANIIYSTGCGTNASVSFIVNSGPAVPAPVVGIATVCFGGSTALSSITPGGAWSSDNTSVATVDPVGVVSTIAAGTANISYTVTNMCGSASSSALVTAESPLIALPAITGPTSFCEGTFISLSNSMAGGAWSSSNTSVATVNSMGLVGGVAAGSATIAYTVSNTCNTASVTTGLTINPLPAPAAIIGSTAPFCEGTTIALSDPTPGGVWSSNLTAIATVNSAGVVTGVSGGSSTIFYSLTNGCGTVAAILIVTVDPMPVLSPVTGNLVVCAGATTQLSDTATSGAWSSGNTALAVVSNTGLVTALFAGVVPISYTAVNSCGVIASVASVTVTTTPILGPITGPSTVCVGSSINLANSTPGGTWSTDVIAVANINTIGVVVGLMVGTDSIRYRVTNACGTSMVAKGIEVLPASTCGPVKASEVASAVTELKVFPNPSSGAFTWNLLCPTNEPVDVVITNVVGKQVLQFTAVTNKDNNLILDVPGGVYFISVRTLAGTYNAKITITR